MASGSTDGRGHVFGDEATTVLQSGLGQTQGNQRQSSRSDFFASVAMATGRREGHHMATSWLGLAEKAPVRPRQI